MPNYKLISGGLPVIAQIGTVTEGIGFPLRPVESSSTGVGAPVIDIPTGALIIDLATGPYYDILLTQNITSLTIANAPPAGQGATIWIRFRQDATGGRTVALPASFKATGGSDTAVASAANAYTVLGATTVDGGIRWEYTMQDAAA